MSEGRGGVGWGGGGVVQGGMERGEGGVGRGRVEWSGGRGVTISKTPVPMREEVGGVTDVMGGVVGREGRGRSVVWWSGRGIAGLGGRGSG